MMQHPPHHQLPDHLFRDWISFLLVFVLALGYLAATVVLKRKRRNWSGWHTLSFLVGTALLGTALLMYYWGDLSELLLTIALFAIWYQTRKPAKHRLFPLTS